MNRWTSQWISWAWAPTRSLGAVVKSALTGPDGASWAPGRIMGFVVFGVSQCLVIRASADVLGAHPRVEAWASFFAGVAAFEAAICATATGMVLGMAPTDPGGRWWGREASPPPPLGR